MEDTIRIDVEELAVISDQLRRIVLDMDRLGDELRRTWYHLPQNIEQHMYPELESLRSRICLITERTGEIAVRVMRAAEDFADCEYAAGKRFMDDDMGYLAWMSAAARTKDDKKA